MKQKIILMMLLLIGQISFAQITSEPEFPTETEPITIFLDATGTGLEGYSGDVYAHTGVTINDNKWQHTIGDWGNNTNQPKLTRLSDDYYSLEVSPSVRDFYQLNANEIATEICVVFRSSDGSQQTSDLFLKLYSTSNEVSIANVDTNNVFSINDSVLIQAVGMFADTMKLFIADTLYTAIDSTILSVKVKATLSGKNYFKVVGKNNTETDTAKSFFFVRNENNVEALPANLEYGINYIDNNTVTLVLYAPDKEYVFLKGDFNNWGLNLESQMNITPDGDVFWKTLTGLTETKEYAFQYYIDNEINIADPYTDKVLDPWNDEYISNSTYPDLMPYPNGGQGIVSVFQTAQTPYNWQITS